MSAIDLVVCSLPPLVVDRPPGAPALLKSAVEEAGYTCQTLDLSIDFFINQCDKNVEQYNTLTSVFRPQESGSEQAEQSAQQWVNESIDKLKAINPTIVGLSVFTNFQHRATVRLAQAIRTHLPDVKIIVGGMGLIVNASSLSLEPGIKKIDLIKLFPQYLTEKQLVDFVVPYGNELTDLVNILEQVVGITEKTKKINYQEETVIYNNPIPNYDNYGLDNYLWSDSKALPVTGSKGCVRACTFCDIPGQFGKFKYRTGRNIADEILHQKKTYNINKFEFTDSLVNGSLKAFKEWLTIVADYNDQQLEENQIRWFGQYICRPQRHMPEEIYSLMSRAGVSNLTIGLESGSNYILNSMKKHVTVEDYYEELDQFQKYGIKAQYLFLPGFYNETWDRFLETLNCLIKLQKYVASGTITNIGVGPPLFLNDQMSLAQQADELGLIIDPLSGDTWRTTYDTEYDFVERARRRLIIELLLEKLGVSGNYQSSANVSQMYLRLKDYENKLLETMH
jgi:tRNA A37 methylthiotransferase MiaB